MSSNTTARTARRRTLRVATAALIAAAGLSLTACNNNDANASKPAGRTDTATAESGSSGSSGGAQGSDSQPGSGTKSGGKTGTSVQRCHTSGLTAAFATGEDATPDPAAGGSTTTSIVLTNKSGRTCKIGGFPGVDLKTEHGGESWSLQRSSAKYSSITLGPGDSTDFTLNVALAEEDAEDGFWAPAFVTVTPPNETTSLTIDWPWGALVDQRGATHPATFVNPIG
ncbi:DUF4232 domain-containing protein [Streptomyces sp. NPDC048636]|uniref:DUF4232 domain-containing protein n=1 Tax=Streptomyces sp. NPDC048636 TaxID=3155762 RepID=UPI00343DF0FF